MVALPVLQVSSLLMNNVLAVADVLTVKLSVAVLSHPALLVRIAVCVPAALKVKPFQA